MMETEAKTKWCPFARYVSHNGEGINRWVTAEDTQLSPDPAKCLGAGCMAWRDTGHIVGAVLERRRALPGETRPDGWGYEAKDSTGPSAGGDWVRRERGAATGYCGLAGADA